MPVAPFLVGTQARATSVGCMLPEPDIANAAIKGLAAVRRTVAALAARSLSTVGDYVCRCRNYGAARRALASASRFLEGFDENPDIPGADLAMRGADA